MFIFTKYLRSYKKYIKRLDDIYYRSNSQVFSEQKVTKCVNERTRIIHNISLFKYNGMNYFLKIKQKR